MSSVSSQRSCFRASSARARMIFSPITAPVGFEGEHRTIMRVDLVTAAATASGSMANPSAARASTGTGMAPASLAISA